MAIIPATRLKKELRLLGAPTLVAVGAGLYAAYSASSCLRPYNNLVVPAAAIAQMLLAFLICTLAFGSEFGFSTMARLLSQPVSRTRLWREKMGVLGLVLLTILAADVPLFAFYHHVKTVSGAPVVTGPVGRLLDSGLGLGIFVGLVALGTAPLMALYLRQTHTAFWASLVTPVLLAILAAFLDITFIQPLAKVGVFDRVNNALFPTLGDYGLPLSFCLPYATLTYFLARRRFLNLEV